MAKEKGSTVDDYLNRWSADAVISTIINPIYTGIHPFPAVITAEEWVEVNVKLIAELGAEEWMATLLAVLKGSYDSYYPAPPAPHRAEDK